MLLRIRFFGRSTIISQVLKVKQLSIRNRYLVALDTVTLTASVALAYLIRFEGPDIPPRFLTAGFIFASLVVPVKLIIFLVTGMYRRLWSYASIAELERILGAIGCATLASAVVGFLLPKFGGPAAHVPWSVLVLDSLISAALIVAPRLLYRSVSWHSQRRRRVGDLRAIVAGAGSAGQMIAKELLTHPNLGIRPVAFVDDDARKRNHRLHGIPVLGSIADIKGVAEIRHANALVIAMPSVPGQIIRPIVRAATEAGLKIRIVPSLADMLSGRPTALREVQIEDLLRREPVETNLSAVQNLAKGRTVLVTGAGGSIGSELCRQLSVLGPSRLVILGHGENSIFEILAELRTKFPAIHVTPVIADVRDHHRMTAIFDEYRPYAVFHAAAHKHVPLMEDERCRGNH